MPVIDDSAYLTVEQVALLIRALTNDMIFSQAGEIFPDSTPYLFPLVNDSLEWFTNEVNNHGIDTFTKETILTPILPIGVNDPGAQVNVSDTGYFNGALNFIEPQVPSDLLEPLRIWERQTNTTNEWRPMKQVLDGLPSVVQTDRLGIWEWRSDEIVMPGAVQSNDLRLRYAGSQARLVTINDTLYFRGATGPVAYKTAATWVASKNPEVAAALDGEAQKRMSQLATRNARTKQRAQTTRRSYGSARCGNYYVPQRNP